MSSMLQQLQFKCPCCQKLYQAQTSEIHVSEPEFICKKCQTQFSFIFPPLDPKNVVTQNITELRVSNLESAKQPKKSLRLSDFAKDLNFVENTQDLDALPIALRQTQKRQSRIMENLALTEMRAVNPIQAKVEETLVTSWDRSRHLIQTKYPGVYRFMLETNWVRVAKVTPFVVASLLILIGLLSHGSRNLVGVGTSLTFLYAGIIIFFKGRLRFRDFWD